ADSLECGDLSPLSIAGRLVARSAICSPLQVLGRGKAVTSHRSPNDTSPHSKCLRCVPPTLRIEVARVGPVVIKKEILRQSICQTLLGNLMTGIVLRWASMHAVQFDRRRVPCRGIASRMAVD